MHSFSKSIPWTASLLLLVPFTDATSSPWITLSSFQQISGFSSVCAKAYNTPLTQCTQKDFAPGRACSMKCVEQLEGVSALINTQCKGTKAYPDTLIGMFFTKAGVSTLCPNVLDSTDGSGGISEGQSSQSTSTSETLPQTTVRTTTTEISSTSQTTTLSVASSTSISSSTPSASSAVPTTSSSATSETQEAEPTLNPSATLTQSRLSGIGSSIVLAASSTSSSASATASSSQDRDNTRNGGGSSGGTPFDISASNRNIAHMSWVVPSLVCLLTGMWLV